LQVKERQILREAAGNASGKHTKSYWTLAIKIGG
jgi:hypothetical protein